MTNIVYTSESMMLLKIPLYVFIRAWWFTPIILPLRRQRSEDHKVEAILSNIVRPCLKNSQKLLFCVVCSCSACFPFVAFVLLIDVWK
jgi:hypothetical protein